MIQRVSSLLGLRTWLRPGRPHSAQFNGPAVGKLCPLETAGLRRCEASIVLFVLSFGLAHSQTFHLPPRPIDAASGSAFVESITSLTLAEREARIEAEVLRGNVPDFLRRLHPVVTRASVAGAIRTATFFVTPDYLAIGSNEDYFLTPMTPQTAQRIAGATGCLLPTRRMVDAIHSAAGVKLVPAPIPPSAAMTSVAVFAQHNAMVRTQRLAQAASHPPGSLVAGHKKDVVWSNRLTNAPGQVAIYGWHKPDGQPIQPLYTGHSDAWVDYSHGIRLVQATLTLDGKERPVAEVLRDPKFAALLSDEGPLAGMHYGANDVAATNRLAVVRLPSIPARLAWQTNPAFAERSATFQLLPDVRVQLNEPLPSTAGPGHSPVLLVIYALPNGNTIEQTAGRKLQPGDDWHFGIQHIAAQTRFVRLADTNRMWMVAYLEAAQKSWPAWRKANAPFPEQIPALVGSLAQMQTNRAVRIVLSGHSGGGSFIFGFLNAVGEIPDNIERIALLDANYAYDPAQGHAGKFARWLRSSDRHYLSVLAYNDAVALLDGKPFVSATGGTWYRSHLMQTNLAEHFEFTRRATNGLEAVSALWNRVQLLLKDNPERRIFHTVQVERNGFIQSMFSGTPLEGRGYEYFGPRAYERWIEPAPSP
jgi:hypothetical protein